MPYRMELTRSVRVQFGMELTRSVRVLYGMDLTRECESAVWNGIDMERVRSVTNIIKTLKNWNIP